LRALPPGAALPLSELAQQLTPDESPASTASIDVDWLLDLARALARDGLIDLQDRGNGSALLSLPN
jgi:hypothetical protein